MPGGPQSFGWAVVAGVVASLALVAGPAQAATINVNTNADEVTPNSNCSLREAITAANTDSAFDGCTAGSGADTIALHGNTTYPEQLSGSEDANAGGDFDISGDLTIQGAGAGSTIIDGAFHDRVFQIPSAVTVVINGVTIQHGDPPANGASRDGGGILNAGNLTLNNDIVTDNRTNSVETSPGTAGGNGGGISNSGALVVNATSIDHNGAGDGTGANHTGGAGGGISNVSAGTLTVTASTIASNDAGGGDSSSGSDGGAGGGISSAGTGVVTITGSTISGNTAGTGRVSGAGGSGGGIRASGGGMVTISASTISGNKAGAANTGPGGFGGGLRTSNNLVLTNSTVANNTGGNASSGVIGHTGGVFVDGGSATLTSDTVAGNAHGTGGGGSNSGGITANSAGTMTVANTIVAASTGPNCEGAVANGLHNVSFGDATCAGFATGNPNLGPLQGNGGPTQTMSVAGPVAVDQVPASGASCPATDQRGIVRPQGAACDIGAFEVVSPTTLSVSKAGTGTGAVTSSPAGINCGATCSAQYIQHSRVTLTATPSAGSTFSGWSGGGCSGTGTCTVALNANTTVSASFAATPPPIRAPNTKITKTKVSQKKNTATFKFKAKGAKATGFQCALVKSRHQKPKFRPCTSPKRYRHLKPHRYAFGVRAVGPGGVDPTVAGKKFRIK